VSGVAGKIALAQEQGAEAQPTSFGMAHFFASRDSSHAVGPFSKDFPTTSCHYQYWMVGVRQKQRALAHRQCPPELPIVPISPASQHKRSTGVNLL
jgi:hypothetical protein